jgi:hypothetical protein
LKNFKGSFCLSVFVLAFANSSATQVPRVVASLQNANFKVPFPQRQPACIPACKENNMPSKNIPPRDSEIAEEYAKKVRVEPPKATRQEDPLVEKRGPVGGQHDHGPAQKPKNKKYPEGGQEH